MPVSLLLDRSVSIYRRWPPFVNSGKVFVLECPSHTIFMVLCAERETWDNLDDYNRRGQFLKKGTFSLEGSELKLSFIEEWLGDWPSMSEQSYVCAELCEDMEDRHVNVKIHVERTIPKVEKKHALEYFKNVI